MNIIEILKKKDTNKKYITNYKGTEMIIKVVKCHGGEYDIVRVLKEDNRDRALTEFMYMSEIVNLEFKEVIDWSKIPVDTKVLVSEDGKEWNRRHFAKYEDGKVYCFNSGYTSFTIVNYGYLSNATIWKYVKLYEE
jgi:hypothetical protein